MVITMHFVTVSFKMKFQLSNYKLSDYMIGSQLEENILSFKPITFMERVVFFIWKTCLDDGNDDKVSCIPHNVFSSHVITENVKTSFWFTSIKNQEKFNQ